MQTEKGTSSIQSLPNEIILQILSYLVADIDNLSKPWSETCYLFREMNLKAKLEAACQSSGLNYKQLKDEYNHLQHCYKHEILPLKDFIECAVTRETIHQTGRYEIFKGEVGYPYIPSLFYQVSYLNSNKLPTQNTLRMAMIVGNVPLCLSLLEDKTLYEFAKSCIKSILKGRAAHFSLYSDLNTYAAAIPWGVLNRSLARTFIACYEKLQKEENDLPSREEVLQVFLDRKAFGFVEECIKQWGIEAAIPFAEDLLFNAPYHPDRTISWQTWCKKLGAVLNDTQCIALAQAFHESFLNYGKFYFTWYEANRLLSEIKKRALFFQISDLNSYIEQPLVETEACIQIEHIFHKDEQYIGYLLKQGLRVQMQMLLTAIESLDVCTAETRKRAFDNIQQILIYQDYYLELLVLRKTLWSKAIKFGFLPILKLRKGVVALDNITLPQKILVERAKGIKTSLHIIKLNDSSTLLKLLQKSIIREAEENTIYHLLKSGVRDWNADWHDMAKKWLAKDDYHAENLFLLLQYLLDNQYLEPSIELFYALSNYIDRLLHFVYQASDFTVNINLADVVRFQWSVLEILMTQKEKLPLNNLKDITSDLENSMSFFVSYTDSSKFHHLISMVFCNTFKLKVLKLADEFFLEKRYPLLLNHLEEVSSAQNELSKILSCLGRKWWRTLVARRAGQFVHYALTVTCELILSYQISNLELIQDCLISLKSAYYWERIPPLMAWKLKVSGFTQEDKVALESCFDKNGRFLGPIGNRTMLEWKNRLSEREASPVGANVPIKNLSLGVG